MFVASYARLRPGSRFHLGVNVQTFPCNALYRVFAVTIKLWVGSDRLLYSVRYHLGTTALRLGPFTTMRGTTSVPLGPSITMRGAASVPLGPSITMRGTASVPLGLSITNARYRHPVCVLQSSNCIGVRNFQENTKTNQQKTTKRNLSVLRAQPFLTNAWAWAWPLTYPKMNCVFGGMCGLH